MSDDVEAMPDEWPDDETGVPAVELEADEDDAAG